MKSRNLLNAATLILLSAIFVASGLDKLFHYRQFVNALRDYVVLPRGFAPYLALPIILMELLISLGLTLPRSRRLASGLGAITIFVFTIALVLNYHYGANGICGCWFTITLAEGNTMHITQNGLVLLLFLILYTNPAAAPRATHTRKENEDESTQDSRTNARIA